MTEPVKAVEVEKPEEPVVEVPAEVDKPLGPNGEKALQAERVRARAAEKLAAEREAKIKEFEAAGLSELEKAQAKAAELERKFAESEARMLRAEVAVAKSVPASLAARLIGSTREELEADADRLIADLKVVSPGLKPDVSQGSRDESKVRGVAAGAEMFAARRRPVQSST